MRDGKRLFVDVSRGFHATCFRVAQRADHDSPARLYTSQTIRLDPQSNWHHSHDRASVPRHSKELVSV